MKKSLNNHTTVILLIRNGVHRYRSWACEATSKECWDFVREVLKNLKPNEYVYEMFLACGLQSMRYTRNEVIELAGKVS